MIDKKIVSSILKTCRHISQLLSRRMCHFYVNPVTFAGVFESNYLLHFIIYCLFCIFIVYLMSKRSVSYVLSKFTNVYMLLSDIQYQYNISTILILLEPTLQVILVLQVAVATSVCGL